MEPSPLVIAIDAGQTGIKVEVEGQRTSLPGLRTNVEIMPQLATVALGVLEERRPERWVLAVGSTGLTEAESDPAILAGLCGGIGRGKVILAHDSITCYLGARGTQHGVVVAAGTGSVILGVGPRGAARVDGWGNIIGDAGSGYWIGRAALDAAMRDFDGRGRATVLTDLARQVYPDLTQAYILIQTSPNRVAEIAALAEQVTVLASTDDVAADICRDAGRELATSAIAAATRVGLSDQPHPPICLTGGVLRAAPVAAACCAALDARWPGFEPTEALGDGLRGAVELAHIPEDHPMRSDVGIAWTSA